MKIPHQALVALANGERLVIMRNVGQAFEPKLERVSEPDLLLTNFSAGVRHQDPAGQRNGSTDIDELAHGAAIAEWFNKATLNGAREPVVIAADPKTLGQIRQHCHQELQARIVGELAKDLTNSPLPEIERVLSEA
jgi:protein required for attachment to host cells